MTSTELADTGIATGFTFDDIKSWGETTYPSLQWHVTMTPGSGDELTITASHGMFERTVKMHVREWFGMGLDAIEAYVRERIDEVALAAGKRWQ